MVSSAPLATTRRRLRPIPHRCATPGRAAGVAGCTPLALDGIDALPSLGVRLQSAGGPPGRPPPRRSPRRRQFTGRRAYPRTSPGASQRRYARAPGAPCAPRGAGGGMGSPDRGHGGYPERDGGRGAGAGDGAAVVVISGIQGAGKSTVADRLARRFPRAARVSADAMQEMIVSGGRWPEQPCPLGGGHAPAPPPPAPRLPPGPLVRRGRLYGRRGRHRDRGARRRPPGGAGRGALHLRHAHPPPGGGAGAGAGAGDAPLPRVGLDGRGAAPRHPAPGAVAGQLRADGGRDGGGDPPPGLGRGVGRGPAARLALGLP